MGRAVVGGDKLEGQQQCNAWLPGSQRAAPPPSASEVGQLSCLLALAFQHCMQLLQPLACRAMLPITRAAAIGICHWCQRVNAMRQGHMLHLHGPVVYWPLAYPLPTWGSTRPLPRGRWASEQMGGQAARLDSSALSGQWAAKLTWAIGWRRGHPAPTWQWLAAIMCGLAQTCPSIQLSPTTGATNNKAILEYNGA